MLGCLYRIHSILVVFVLVASTAQGQTGTSRASSTLAKKAAVQLLDLGTLVPGGWSVAYGINSRGHVVGYVDIDDPNVPFYRTAPFLWTPTQGLQPIPIPDLWYGLARDVNDRDEVVGYYYDTGGNAHGFLWSPGDGFVDLGTEFIAVSINDRRQIAGVCPGWRDADENLTAQPCLWEEGTVSALGLWLGSWYDFSAYWENLGNINARGEVVGSALNAAGWGGWLWNPQAGVLQLPLQSAKAINDAGQMVGHIGDHTVVLSRRGGILRTSRGDLQPLAINSRGWVVGYYYDEWIQTSFLWQPNGVILTLGSESYAADVNNRGQVVGFTRMSDGTYHAVIWTVHASNAQEQ